MADRLAADGVKIAFDATSAYVHAKNAAELERRGILTIDLTPAAIGPYCVPPVNLAEHAGRGEPNVNMVSCGGQATIPMVAAVSRVQPVAYAEIVVRDELWPDFRQEQFLEALLEYRGRERRFGKTSAQLRGKSRG